MAENEVIRTRLRAAGRVQGVGFRWFVLSEARRLGLAGWVRNNDDGSVELEAEGPASHIAALRARVAEGPPAARVDRVEELPATGNPLPTRFTTTA